MTAVLYYGISEIQKMTKGGQMLQMPVSRVRLSLDLKTTMIGQVYVVISWLLDGLLQLVNLPTGEIVTSITAIGVLLYDVVVCKKRR